MMRYLLCELNDENYTDASFYFFYTLSMANNAAILDCVKNFDGNCEIETENNGLRVTSRNGDSFYVIEIKEFDEDNGTHLLVWHHGYEGVDFEIRFQGTYEECCKQREREIKELIDELELLDDDVNGNVVDTGNEWEVWDIVEIKE